MNKEKVSYVYEITLKNGETVEMGIFEYYINYVIIFIITFPFKMTFFIMNKVLCLIFGHYAHRKDLKHYKKCKRCGKHLENYHCETFWGARCL